MSEEQIEPVLKVFGYVPERVSSVRIDSVLEDGDKINGLEVLHFPGHSAGHIGLRVGEYLLTGDLILSQTLTQNWPATFFPFCGFARTVESMKKLSQLTKSPDPPQMLLPGHEDPIPKIQQRIDMVKKSEDRRNNRLMRLLNESKEGMTINELAKMMFWTAHINRTFFALADVAARLEYSCFAVPFRLLITKFSFRARPFCAGDFQVEVIKPLDSPRCGELYIIPPHCIVNTALRGKMCC